MAGRGGPAIDDAQECRDPCEVCTGSHQAVLTFEIDAPDAAGSRSIAAAIYGEIRNSHDWGRQFPEALPEPALDKLASMPPREMRRALQGAFGTAKLAGLCVPNAARASSRPRGSST